MKKNGIKFDASTATEVPVLTPGAMVRKGQTGSASEDGMTPEISAHLRAAGNQVFPDQQALQWFYEGGPLPT